MVVSHPLSSHSQPSLSSPGAQRGTEASTENDCFPPPGKMDLIGQKSTRKIKVKKILTYLNASAYICQPQTTKNDEESKVSKQ